MGFVARDYQIEAYENFKSNSYHGIFEMATGTGKTFTSLMCASEYFKENKRLFLIIFVPFNHLVPQWQENAKVFGFRDFLTCNNLKTSWLYELEDKVRDFNGKISNLECVITSYKTASSKEFNHIISKIKNSSFLIADECHYFGIKQLRSHSLHSIECKLGLSATPDRWWDDFGSAFIKNYFGGTVYEYSMEEAIEKGVLTEYNYYPIKCSLDEEEYKEYKKLSDRIVKLSFEAEKNQDFIESLSRKRAMIVSKAKAKKQYLLKLLNTNNKDLIKNTLVYCAPGDIDEITTLVSKLGIRVHRFDSRINMAKRKEVLERFEKGEIQVLVAIKCLDEGVDVPSTEIAYFLSSTTNPREFIQRRGRILRKAQGKKMASIYDFMIIQEEAEDKIYESIVRKEMPRFAEFSRYALNKYEARTVILEKLMKSGLADLMDKLPWVVYKENLLRREGI